MTGKRSHQYDPSDKVSRTVRVSVLVAVLTPVRDVEIFVTPLLVLTVECGPMLVAS